MEIVGYTTSDLALAIDTIDAALDEGESARLRLCTTRLPTDIELANFVVAVYAAGGQTSFPTTRLARDVAVTEMILTKGNPLLLLIPIIVPLATIGLITFGIVKVGDISSAIMPILLATGGILLLGVVILAPKAERVATKYVEAGGKLKYLASVEALPATSKKKPTRYDVEIHTWAERDRLHIEIRDKKTGKTLAEWWDDDARQMFEGGFFKPGIIRHEGITGREFEDSVLEYAEDMGILASDNPPKHLPKDQKQSDEEYGEKLIGQNIVRHYKIIGAPIMVYNAWEPDQSDHSNIQFMKSKWYGRIGTKRLPPELEKLPAYSSERIERVSDWREREYQRAYELISEAYPETDSQGARRVGEIEIFPWRALPKAGLLDSQAATVDFETRRASATKKLAEWFVERLIETGKFPILTREVVGGIVVSYIDRNEIIEFADWFLSPEGVQLFKQELRAAAVIHKLVNFNPDNLLIGNLLDTKIKYVIISNRGDTELMEGSNVSLEAFEAANQRAISMGVKPATGYEVPRGYKPDDFGGQYKPEEFLYMPEVPAGFTPKVQTVIDSWRKRIAGGGTFAEAEARLDIIRAYAYKVDVGETDRAMRAIKEIAIPKAEANAITVDLKKSIAEEREAESAYMQRGITARELGDYGTQELYRHVAAEESHHAEEFAKRLSELGSAALEFIPDSPEYLTETIQSAGWRDKIDDAFQAAIQRVRG